MKNYLKRTGFNRIRCEGKKGCPSTRITREQNNMCGRYALNCNAPQLAEEFDFFNLPVNLQGDSTPQQGSYNIAPTTSAPVYYHNDQLKYMKWGLIPHWTRDLSKAQPYKTFNARMESLQTNGSKLWLHCRNSHRCVIPMRGFYEWLSARGTKQPYFIKRKDNKLMFVAGMYDVVRTKDQEVYSYTIVTGAAPTNLKWLHERMPVMLKPNSEEWKIWMDDKKHVWTDKELKTVLEPKYPEELMEWYEVSKDVGKVSNNEEYLIKEKKRVSIKKKIEGERGDQPARKKQRI